MYTISDGVINYMSAVIGVCGTNFCTLCSDSRKVVNKGGKFVVDSDTTQKVFKINDRVLLGATGLFDIGELSYAPLKVYQDPSVITLRMAYKAVLDYIERHKRSHMMLGRARNYLVAGKDNHGQFCIYEVHFNPMTEKTETVLRKPKPPQFNFAVSCSLPFSLTDDTQECIDAVAYVLNHSRTHGEMVSGVGNIICKISETDETVGGEIQSVSVF